MAPDSLCVLCPVVAGVSLAGQLDLLGSEKAYFDVRWNPSFPERDCLSLFESELSELDRILKAWHKKGRVCLPRGPGTGAGNKLKLVVIVFLCLHFMV